MSTESYSKWWITTKNNLEKLKSYDDEMKKYPAIKERNLANELLGGLYARYCLVVQDLDTCLDQMCQIQKSFTVRKLMDAATTRLNELKDEMCKIDISEYHYVDGALLELKIIPQSIEVLHPALKYPRAEMYEELWNAVKKGDKIYTPSSKTILPEIVEKVKEKPKKTKKVKVDPMAMLLSKPEENKSKEELPAEEPKEDTENKDLVVAENEMNLNESEPQKQSTKKEKRQKKKPKKTFVVEAPQLTEEEIQAQRKKEKLLEAIVLIQKFERARQSRLYYNDVLCEKNLIKATAGNQIAKPTQNDVDKREECALKIQALWKGYKDRNIMKQREIKRRLIIGMTQYSKVSEQEKLKLQKNVEHRRTLRDEKLREYIKTNLDEKERVLRVIGPGLFEDIGDELREWMQMWYNKGNAFQEIPPEENGGSVLIVRCEVKSLQEYLSELTNQNKQKPKEKTKEQIEKENKANKDKLLKEKERLKKELEKKKKAEAKGELEIKFEETIAHKKLLEGFTEYKELWKDNSDIYSNSIHMNIITEDKCFELQLEIRKQVDVLMRLEMEMLLIALQKDKWISKGRKGKFKPKKAKAQKKKKTKEKKDSTGHRTPEDLLQELIDNGIVRSYPEARLQDYVGDLSYQNWEKRMLEFDPPPTLGDVRQVVSLNCIMPLGVQAMQKPKSVLIVGARKSGKHLLANAIFNETNSVVFDLSAKVLAGKYPGKKGNTMLVHLVNKMSRLLQPSIIFLDQVEKTFYKKVPKEEKDLDPKKAGKFLFKQIIKPLKPEDRVLVLGLSGEPWAAGAGKLNKTFQRIILIPRSDYGTVYHYWQEILMRYHGVDRNFDMSSLTKLTQYYPLNELRKAALSTLVPKRIIQLSYRPLHQSELLTCLLEGEGPVDDKEYSKFIKWYAKTTMGKQRARLNTLNEQKREKEKKNQKK